MERHSVKYSGPNVSALTHICNQERRVEEHKKTSQEKANGTEKYFKRLFVKQKNWYSIEIKVQPMQTSQKLFPLYHDHD